MGQDKFTESLHQAVVQSCQSRLQTFCQIQGVDAENLKTLKDRQTYSNMALVLLSGKNVKLVLKLFFDSDSTHSFFENNKLPEDGGREIRRSAIDGLKEVLNLVAGHLKILLEQVEVTSDISLPVAMRGYDDMFFPVTEKTSTEAVYRLSYKGSEIFLCSLLTTGSTLKEVSLTYQDETSSVELL